MKTANTLHVQRCCHVDSVEGETTRCANDALVTMPSPGDQPRGYCYNHLDDLHTRAAKKSETDLIAAIMRDLGYDVSITTVAA